jgi:hypothetical protein
VTYGFPIENFCNPGVHYETPCIHKVAEKELASAKYTFKGVGKVADIT